MSILEKYSSAMANKDEAASGAYNRQSEKKVRQPAAPTKGKLETFAAVKRAVLRASVRAKQLCSGAAKTAFGVTADFFSAACVCR